MSDSKNSAVIKLRRQHPGTGRPSNLDIVDDAWAADKLSDDEVEVEQSEAAIAPLLEDEGELDDAMVTTTNSGSAASGALERRRKEEGRWNDLGLDLFDNGGMVVGVEVVILLRGNSRSLYNNYANYFVLSGRCIIPRKNGKRSI
eukprot:CAMPEP_0171332204 /NCGR_PEP_ID=MMETSP0878-20121228/3213_1 /TAXON_ID=67004 /ORGANISM="Thalassiosira weissflogii, Strain CCMP1336" /LENGTH=144 /DNA_ID=CAMNT_0011832903 /DNA_START=101 /DNA_END=535 /DNA_ORIENTATION=-